MNLGQNLTQGGPSKGKKWGNSSVVKVTTIEVLGNIPFGSNPKDGVMDDKSLESSCSTIRKRM